MFTASEKIKQGSSPQCTIVQSCQDPDSIVMFEAGVPDSVGVQARDRAGGGAAGWDDSLQLL